ncbi:roadblock/LC7 domain-containing protein [Planosporangium mesophilum]|uniref:Dynein regulation protein LC7 n=1 Tax=Planosporangium mesophilum TaxID=689768 RepID=A0A8J3TCL9_9ACTN|nr:roadblock/LC7 domain-containing protein [Planosporangium mesophilum]NJC84065.1 dynein regulation protein LC7 [Planosporangium mesophilum]GII22931.1 dynein regulation protein LC7 [Planosporangium mesophilum]
MEPGRTPPPSPDADHVNRLLTRFVTQTAGVRAAITVSSDGLLIAGSGWRSRRDAEGRRPDSDGPRADAERLAAITSAVISLAAGASRVFDLGEANKIVIGMDEGYVLVRTINPGCALSVLATKEANLGATAHAMTLFAHGTGEVLTPRLIEALKQSTGL